MTKNPPTGSAQDITDFNERTRALFEDKPEFTPKPSERKNRTHWSTKPKEEAETAENESEPETADDAAADRDETDREEDVKAIDE